MSEKWITIDEAREMFPGSEPGDSIRNMPAATNRFWRGVDTGPAPDTTVIVARMNELWLELIRQREKEAEQGPTQRDQELRRRAELQRMRGRW